MLRFVAPDQQVDKGLLEIKDMVAVPQISESDERTSMGMICKVGEWPVGP